MRAPPFEPGELEFRHLSPDCTTGAFSCGERDLDHWFRKHACKAHDGYECRTTTVRGRGEESILGFYSLAFVAEDEKLLAEPGRNAYFPAMHIEWLAVARRVQHRRLGRILMGRIIDLYIHAIQEAGLQALTLVALNEKVEGYYADMGFRRYATGFTGKGRRMLLPAETALSLSGH